MKIPVIRGSIGQWRYYTGVMTFEQISIRVSPSINEIYPAGCLNDLLQRDLTDNYKNIKDYIENDAERFFNALILAVYNGDPQWLEVEFDDEYDEVYNVGFLDLPEEIIVFPVDGQHRVAGIKEALKEKPELASEQVPVVFIAHENNPDGRKRTRKLFSTLNRRAKPVGENAQIALDEDDVNAIITRSLIESCELFKDKRLINAKGKQIPPNNTGAFTSLVTLYQCNEVLLQDRFGKNGIAYKRYLLYRPKDSEISELESYIFDYWNSFSLSMNVIKEYLTNGENAALEFRNSDGGNILFRPAVLTEFTKAVCIIKNHDNKEFGEVFEALNQIQMNLSTEPWKGVLWDGKRINTRVNKSLIKSLIIYMYSHDALSDRDKEKMLDAYIAAINFEGERKEIEGKLSRF